MKDAAWSVDYAEAEKIVRAATPTPAPDAPVNPFLDPGAPDPYVVHGVVDASRAEAVMREAVGRGRTPEEASDLLESLRTHMSYNTALRTRTFQYPAYAKRMAGLLDLFVRMSNEGASWDLIHSMLMRVDPSDMDHEAIEAAAHLLWADDFAATLLGVGLTRVEWKARLRTPD